MVQASGSRRSVSPSGRLLFALCSSCFFKRRERSLSDIHICGVLGAEAPSPIGRLLWISGVVDINPTHGAAALDLRCFDTPPTIIHIGEVQSDSLKSIHFRPLFKSWFMTLPYSRETAPIFKITYNMQYVNSRRLDLYTKNRSSCQPCFRAYRKRKPPRNQAPRRFIFFAQCTAALGEWHHRALLFPFQLVQRTGGCTRVRMTRPSIRLLPPIAGDRV